jgi:hypothetical protein
VVVDCGCPERYQAQVYDPRATHKKRLEDGADVGRRPVVAERHPAGDQAGGVRQGPPRSHRPEAAEELVADMLAGTTKRAYKPSTIRGYQDALTDTCCAGVRRASLGEVGSGRH